MKNRFGFMLILLLTFAVMSCPCLVNRAFADEGNSPAQKSPRKAIRAVLQITGQASNLADFESTFPTTIQDLIALVTNSNVVTTIQDIHDNMVGTRQDIVNRFKDAFGRATPASGN